MNPQRMCLYISQKAKAQNDRSRTYVIANVTVVEQSVIIFHDLVRTYLIVINPLAVNSPSKKNNCQNSALGSIANPLISGLPNS